MSISVCGRFRTELVGRVDVLADGIYVESFSNVCNMLFVLGTTMQFQQDTVGKRKKPFFLKKDNVSVQCADSHGGCTGR